MARDQRLARQNRRLRAVLEQVAETVEGLTATLLRPVADRDAAAFADHVARLGRSGCRLPPRRGRCA